MPDSSCQRDSESPCVDPSVGHWRRPGATERNPARRLGVEAPGGTHCAGLRVSESESRRVPGRVDERCVQSLSWPSAWPDLPA